MPGQVGTRHGRRFDVEDVTKQGDAGCVFIRHLVLLSSREDNQTAPGAGVSPAASADRPGRTETRGDQKALKEGERAPCNIATPGGGGAVDVGGWAVDVKQS